MTDSIYEVLVAIIVILAPLLIVVGCAVMIAHFYTDSDFFKISQFFGILMAGLTLPILLIFGSQLYEAILGGELIQSLRVFKGPYRFIWFANTLGSLASQLFWIPSIRRSSLALVIIGIIFTAAYHL